LPRVEGARLDRHAQCALEVCARHHDERIAAAELEHAFFDLSRGRTRHSAPRFFAARQRYRFNARIENYLLHLLRLDEQRLENAIIKSGAAKNFFDGKPALRDIGGVL